MARSLPSPSSFLSILNRRIRSCRTSQLSSPNSNHLQDAVQLADAEFKWLRDHVLRCNASCASKSDTFNGLSRKQRRELLSMTLRLIRKEEPIAYILGSQPFGRIDVKCRPPTLIPRTETEEWSLRVLYMLKTAFKREEGRLDVERRGSEDGPSTASSTSPFTSSLRSSDDPKAHHRELKILDMCCGTG